MEKVMNFKLVTFKAVEKFLLRFKILIKLLSVL